MQYKCDKCQDTGSTSKHLSGNLDCISCDASSERAALETWLGNNSAMGDQDIVWLVHQRALAMAPKQEAPTQEPIGMVAKSSFASHKVLVATVQLDDVPLGAKLYLAALGAANGALTDEQILAIGDNVKLTYKCNNGKRLSFYHDGFDMRNEVIAFARAILAAAGPDAALIDERQAFEAAFRKDEGIPSDIPSSSLCCDREWMGWQWRAALSGAKGN